MIRKVIKGGNYAPQLIGELVFDMVPEEGSFNPITSDAAAKLSSQYDEKVEEAKGAIKDGGALTDASSIDVPNNSFSTLSSSEEALTLNVNIEEGDVPNFVVEITAGADIALTVTKTVGETTTALKYSTAAGYELDTGKVYQVKCVGSCWSLEAFSTPA